MIALDHYARHIRKEGEGRLKIWI